MRIKNPVKRLWIWLLKKLFKLINEILQPNYVAVEITELETGQILNLHLEISSIQRCLHTTYDFEDKVAWSNRLTDARRTMEASMERLKDKYAPDEYRALDDPHAIKLNFQSGRIIFFIEGRHYNDWS